MGAKNIRLIALEMENFQSLTDRVRLDFSPITLLYGPNSAGKSSVFDAFELLKSIFNPLRPPQNVFDNYIKKWAHEPIKLSPILDRSLSLAIEIQPRTDTLKVIDHPTRSFYSIARDDLLNQILEEGTIRFEYKTKIYDETVVLDRLSIFAKVENLYGDGKYADLKILELIARIPGDDDSACECYPDIDAYLYLDILKADWYKDFDYRTEQNFSSNFLKENLVVVANKFCFAKLDHMGPDIFHSESDPYFEHDFDYWKFKEGYLDIVILFGKMLCEIIDEALPLVKADRTIPTPNSLVFLNEGIALEKGKSEKERQPFWFGSITPNFYPKLFDNADHFYKELAYCSHFNKTYLALKDSIYSDEKDPDFPKKQHISSNSLELKNFQRINKYLSDYLFLEKGYRVDSDSQYLIPSDLLTEASADIVARCTAITKVFLVDSSGRKLEIEDVGSGIAFVLPILVSVSHHKISLIQQPELHLHPALQSCLAEVFIDRLSESDDKDLWQSIIETHSEHMLLRILRRIRETEQGKDISTKLTPEDVAVYYFNPNPQGGTEVRKMLITPLGDFYNTWPRGFFDERYKDLFDE